jgi:hypothetical protein
MDVSTRSKFSLCQLLLLFERDEIVLLLGKYGLPTDGLQSRWGGISPAAAVREAIIVAAPLPISELMQEVRGANIDRLSRQEPRTGSPKTFKRAFTGGAYRGYHGSNTRSVDGRQPDGAPGEPFV